MDLLDRAVKKKESAENMNNSRPKIIEFSIAPEQDSNPPQEIINPPITQPTESISPSTTPQKLIEPIYKPANYKTVPCRLYHSSLGCSRGEFCHFIHEKEYEGKDLPAEFWKNKRKKPESPYYGLYPQKMLPFPLLQRYMCPPGFTPKDCIPLLYSKHLHHTKSSSSKQ